MAKSARQTVFEGMEILPEALAPFVEKRLESSLKGHWQLIVVEKVRNLKPDSSGQIVWDQSALLNTMNIYWDTAFRAVLGKSERALVNELAEVRNQLAHNGTFSYDDAERALDSIRRLLQAISAGDAAEKIGRMRETILRTKFAEMARNEERRKTKNTELSVETVAGLKPWREVVEPHSDVASGDFKQAEFAADLGTVHKGEAPAEYGDPQEFFGRTYLTDGLSALLLSAAKRLNDDGGDPVVELQTNFGGGKTHSMLALFHMAGSSDANALPGLDQLLHDSNITLDKATKRAVFVGTHVGPSDIEKTDCGLSIRTTWGRLAWQLGGAEGFAQVAEADAQGVSPGAEVLIKLFKSCGRCLILIDEWVAFLRQVYKVDGLAAGSFDANLSFVQALTEAVKASPGTLLVASLPASQIEVGGEGGEEALKRLKQTFSRVESSWRPATQEESYEIVRRRLFKEIPPDSFQHRDNTLKQYAKLYRENSKDFPPDCEDADYRRKLQKAYPIHPELFDQLYLSWGAVEKFQRTRGVLRLMAQVIHELWMGDDPSVMIMPGSVTVQSERVEPELLKYLEANWISIIATDIDGGDSTPYRVDKDRPNLARYSATRRVARAVFLATAPGTQSQNQGLDDRRINLGVVQPGEKAAIFGDALRRLSNQAKYLHSESGRYWYSTKPSLNRLAADRASQQDEATILAGVDSELKQLISRQSDRGHFDGIHITPNSTADVPDEASGVRLVVLGVKTPHSTRGSSLAKSEANSVLLQRGSASRIYRNVLVFLAADEKAVDQVLRAARNLAGWREVVRDIDRLDLTQSDSALAKNKLSEAEATFSARLREAWCYVLYPEQNSPQEELHWATLKFSSDDNFLKAASKKLINDDVMSIEKAPSGLMITLEKSIWPKDKPHLRLAELWDYMCRYNYLPRLTEKNVLTRAVQAAVGGVTPGMFAYAESYDEASDTYRGLILENALNAPVMVAGESVMLRASVAEQHRQSLNIPPEVIPPQGEGGKVEPGPVDGPGPTAVEETLPKHFHAEVELSSERPNRDMGQIVEAIIDQISTLPGAKVTLRLEISGHVPDGMDKAKVRTLVENTNTLGFQRCDID